MPNKKNIIQKKILVVGLGLIGASLCRSLKKTQRSNKIYGYDISKKVMDYALKNNFIDNIKEDLESGIKDSDLIVICTPVEQITKILNTAKIFFNTDKIFTDTLSVKSVILEYLTKNNLEKSSNFILSHPMAGTENFGIENSCEDLFLNATAMVCPLPFSKPESVETIKELWGLNNCNVIEVDPYSHDKYLAAISHAPHVISFALARKINNLGYIEEFPWINSKGSLSDMTRIANSDPEAWANILKNNQDNLSDFIDEYLEELSKLKSIIKSDGTAELVSYLKKSKPVK